MDGSQRFVNVEHPTLNCEMAPGGIIAFYADGDMEVIHMNHHAVDLVGCESTADLIVFCKGSFLGLVPEEDQAIVIEFVQRLSHAPGEKGYTYFHIKTKQGQVQNVVLHGKIVQEQEFDRPYCNAFLVELIRFRTVDWLTGLPTADRFRQLAHARAGSYEARGLRPVAVAFDFTGFKSYNDKYGRDEGDEVMRIFARLLIDVFGRDDCTRFGEDHFYAIAEANTAETMVTTLLKRYDGMRSGGFPPIRAGLYVCDSGDLMSNAAFDRAKIACDLDRKAWRSHLSWFTDEMRQAERIRTHVLENLDRAIGEGWIRPYYQGIARSTTSDICGEEALARWVDPEYGLLSPAQFIPIIEEAGVIYRVDLHMVDCVLADIRAKQLRGVPVVPVSVNFSVSDLAKMDIAREVARRADAAGVEHRLLVVELTESAVSSNPELFRKQVNHLRDEGFAVWMDDFGSGYSSLNTLQEFDFDLVKIDMGFTRGLLGDHSERSQSVLGSILRSVSRLGFDTLAEGVESDAQAMFLQSAGCDMLQGYLLSRPHPIEDILDSRDRSPRELPEETAYWDTIGRLLLDDLYTVQTGGGTDSASSRKLPAGIVEMRGSEWRVLRANDSYRAFLDDAGLVPNCRERLASACIVQNVLDPEFLEATQRAIASGTWERVMGGLERGSAFQFYVRHLASSADANAFAIASFPILMGAAVVGAREVPEEYSLGGFGDVPVAYAVCRVVLDEAREHVMDMVHAYVNQLYVNALDTTENELIGQSFFKVVDNASTDWLTYCYRAAVLGERVHDTVFSVEVGHWLSVNVAPSTVEGYCIFAFTYADTEQLEREELAVGLDTADLIIDIADNFSGETSYEVAMNRLLAALSRIAHAQRISLIERKESGSGVIFEWCEEGVEPLIGVMQNMDNAEFADWDRMASKEPLLVVPNVADSEVVDKDHLKSMDDRGIKRMMVVPVKNDNELLGYLVIDNYELDNDLDVQRLLASIASFMGARMVNHRLVTELERAGRRDALTGLLNRRGIDLAIQRAMERYPDEPYVLVLMDIDDFKAVNDVHGHDVGDEALRTLARVVCEAFPPDAVVGRNGGDEFLVFIQGRSTTDVDQMLNDLLEQDLSCVLGNKRYQLSMSAGYATYPSQAKDLLSTYSKADKALYAAKLAGKSGFAAYSHDAEELYRSKLGFAPRDIAENVPGGIIVHRIADEGEILFANDEAVHLFGCVDLTDLMDYTGNSFAGLVRLGDANKEPVVTGHIVAKNGEVRRVVNSSRLVEVAGLGEVVYELLLRLD